MTASILVSAPLILGLWSIVLQPGQTLPQKTSPAIQITNISFGAEVKGDARSVVSIKYPEFEQDSDDEDDEDEDEDEDESEIDEDDDENIKLPKIITKEAVLAILKPNATEQVSLNVSLVEDVEIVEFSVTGENAVHIVGHYIRQEDFDQDPYSDSDFDSEDEEIDSDFITDDEDDEDVDMSGLIGGSDDDEEDDAARFAEIKELVKEDNKKRAAVEEDDEEAGDVSLSKNQKKKLAKKLKAADGAAAAPAPAAKAEAAPAPAKAAAAPKATPKTLPGGLIVLDSKVGTGAQAKSGKKIGMRYIGKLENGKVFDSNTKGAPFVFTLGRGEVIKGWDQGLAGIAVGGERKLTIPAALAYGKKGVSGIPGGATLIFDVKCVSIK